MQEPKHSFWYSLVTRIGFCTRERKRERESEREREIDKKNALFCKWTGEQRCSTFEAIKFGGFAFEYLGSKLSVSLIGVPGFGHQSHCQYGKFHVNLGGQQVVKSKSESHFNMNSKLFAYKCLKQLQAPAPHPPWVFRRWYWSFMFSGTCKFCLKTTCYGNYHLTMCGCVLAVSDISLSTLRKS